MNTYGDDERTWLHSGNFRFERLNSTIPYNNPEEWHYLNGLRRDDWLINIERVEPETLECNKTDWRPFSIFLVTRIGETTMTILLNDVPYTSEYDTTFNKIAAYAWEKKHDIKYVCLHQPAFKGYSQWLTDEWRLNEY